MAAQVETRLYVAADLAPGASVALGGEQAHYLRNVLRLKPGAAVALFNGRDGEFAARIDKLGKGGAALAVAERLRPQPPPPRPAADLWLLFAPIKRANIDFLAEKATELGVTLLWPVMTRHTSVERVNLNRLRANAIEAAQQCGGLSAPDLRAAVPLERALEDWPRDRLLYLCAEKGTAEPLDEAAARHPAQARPAILTGPEGGFHDAELDALKRLPFVTPVALGPLVMRADTAALAAVAVFHAAAGNWRGRT
ncbi:MAG: 16S rRNA (uracil(1498)-N(3))-methyltransferase [Rhodospirillales bacterium]